MGLLQITTSIAAAAAAGAAIAAPPSGAPVTFADVTAASGIDFVHHDAPPVPPLFDGQNTRFGVGAAIGDYDRDGDQDVYVCDSFGWANRLFRNDGTGVFTDVTDAAGVGDLGYSHMALFLDLDDDGWLDLVVINDASAFTDEFPRSQLYRNLGDGTFTNVTEGSGFEPADPTFGGATAGDYDGDGDLDLYIVGWYRYSTYLYRNDGDFRFTDVTDAAGARGPENVFHWTPLFVDVDGDGRQDLFCAVDFAEDYLLHNNGDGTFADVSETAGVQHVANDMGTIAGDIDGDGDLDLYTTNITGSSECNLEWGCNMLYVNDGAGVFTDGTEASGLGDTAWGWGVWLFDAELDGDRDLLAVNGWTQPQFHTPAYFYVNDGANAFTESAAVCGIDHVGNTRALVPLDLEGDGDTDFLVFDVLGPATVYENTTDHGDNHWLVVEAEGTWSNRNGVGSRVEVTAGERTWMDEITAGGSFYAGPALETHFGLGAADVVDAVRVVFPSGRQTVLTGVGVDQRIVVTEPDCFADVDDDNRVGFGDILAVLAAWGPCERGAACAADLDVDGEVGGRDLQLVLDAWGVCE